MSNILTIGYLTEGSTDKRFLGGVIKRTFDEVAFTCENDIEVFDPLHLKYDFAESYVETTLNVARRAFEMGLHVLCVHVDADDNSDKEVVKHKISPLINRLRQEPNNICQNLVSIIPVRMSEAWMLADIDLLREEMGTNKTPKELELIHNPENYNDPKITIENALRIAQENLPKRRHRLGINELYQPIGQLIDIEKLNALPSYRKFKESVVSSFISLNYLR